MPSAARAFSAVPDITASQFKRKNLVRSGPRAQASCSPPARPLSCPYLAAFFQRSSITIAATGLQTMSKLANVNPLILLVLGLSLAANADPAKTAPSADKVLLVPHRAVYDLTLSKSRGSRGVQAVRGRILYDFSGNACDGYELEFRQVSELDSGERKG